jgi:hypothetical protein
MPTPPAPPSSVEYLGTRQVLKRYNRTDESWLCRLVKRKQFPPPDFYLANQKYWMLATIERHEAELRKAGVPSFNEPPRREAA